MAYQVLSDDGTRLDAHFDVDQNTIIFHSRGGAKNRNPRNIDYSVALRLLIQRLAEAGYPMQKAWVDSIPVQDMPVADRVIVDSRDAGTTASELGRRMAARMQAIGREPGSKVGGGNSSKRIRIQISKQIPQAKISSILKAVRVNRDFRSDERLPASDLAKVTPEHLFEAVQELLGGRTDHGFGDSTDFDVVLDGNTRLAPKAVFGIAASNVLGREIGPRNFTGGRRSASFRSLTRAGYVIVPKGADAPTQSELDQINLERSEGTPKLRAHVRRERAAVFREAKIAQFRRKNQGKLFCEHCGEDPIEKYGTSLAESCIEVHHAKIVVAKMQVGHKTRLDDLKCLCANCHRLVHRKMRE